MAVDCRSVRHIMIIIVISGDLSLIISSVSAAVSLVIIGDIVTVLVHFLGTVRIISHISKFCVLLNSFE